MSSEGMKVPELKPCPFCDGPAQEPENVTPRKRPTWQINCYQYCISMNRNTKNEVIAAWNLRPVEAALIAERDRMREALEQAINAGEYVVRIVEDTGQCGVSPNPTIKSDWMGTAMHCYAAMNFLSAARAALSEAPTLAQP